MHWLFMGVSAFCAFMWARCIYTARAESRELELEGAYRLGRVKGEYEFNWDMAPGEALQCDMDAEDVVLVAAFNGGRVVGWREARAEEIASEAGEFLKGRAA